MFGPRWYFDVQTDPSSNATVLVDKNDGCQFVSKKFKSNCLRWRCIHDKSGCDAYFKTNLFMTTFEGFPHMYHSNHELRPEKAK